eukprot:3067697-Lingulodinium_polyedra.AAC.1
MLPRSTLHGAAGIMLQWLLQTHRPTAPWRVLRGNMGDVVQYYQRLLVLALPRRTAGGNLRFGGADNVPYIYPAVKR